MSTLLQVFFNYCLTSVLDKTVSGEGGNGEWGMGNGEWGTGNGEWGMGKTGARCSHYGKLLNHPKLPKLPKPPKPSSNRSVDTRNGTIGFDRNH